MRPSNEKKACIRNFDRLNSIKSAHEAELVGIKWKERIAEEVEVANIAHVKESEINKKLEAVAIKEAKTQYLDRKLAEKRSVLHDLDANIMDTQQKLHCYQKQLKEQKDLAWYYVEKSKVAE